MKLFTSGEDYLKALLILEKEKGIVRSCDLADHMGFSRASISVAVSNLRKRDFVVMNDDMTLHLTAAGHKLAQQIYERHCFFRDRLVAIGVAPQTAESEACQLEHIVSQDTFERIKNSAPEHVYRKYSARQE